MTHQRDFTIAGAIATVHPNKSDKNTHTLDFTDHVSAIQDVIDDLAEKGLPKLVVVEGKLGNGINYLVEVLESCTPNVVRVQGDSSDYVLPKVKTKKQTFLFDGAYRIDSFSLSLLLERIIETDNTAILLVHHYSEVQVPADLYANISQLKLTRDGLKVAQEA